MAWILIAAVPLEAQSHVQPKFGTRCFGECCFMQRRKKIKKILSFGTMTGEMIEIDSVAGIAKVVVKKHVAAASPSTGMKGKTALGYRLDPQPTLVPFLCPLGHLMTVSFVISNHFVCSGHAGKQIVCLAAELFQLFITPILIAWLCTSAILSPISSFGHRSFY